MDFGENALKNKVQPFIANAPSFSNALSNSKDVPSLYKTWEALTGYRQDTFYQQMERFNPNFNVDDLWSNPKLTVDPEWRKELVRKIQNDEIPEEEKRWIDQTKLSVNEDDYNQIVANQNELKHNRDVMDKSSTLNLFVSGIFQLENLIALPTGGPTAGFVKSFATSFASLAAFESAMEALKYPYDAEANLIESGSNVALTAVTGGLLTGGIRAGGKYFSNKTLKRTEKNIQELNTVLFKAAKPTAEKIAVDLTFKKSKIKKEGIKFLEENRDPMSSKLWGTDNSVRKFFMNAVPTAYKSWNNTFKGTKTYDYMAMLLSDDAMLTVGNMRGESSLSSVASKTKIRTAGTVWKMQEDLTNLWVLETGLKPGTHTFLGINRANVAAGLKQIKYGNKVAPDNGVGTVDMWLQYVNRKAITNRASLSGNEIKAANLMHKYFKDWEPLLRDRGQIGSSTYYKEQVKLVSDRLNKFEKYYQDAVKGNKYKNKKQAEEWYLGEKTKIQNELDEALELLEYYKTKPVMPKGEEYYFPRNWNVQAIKNERQSFEDILTNWIKSQKKSITREEAIVRAKTITKTILNEDDGGVNLNQLYIASNVSKHSRGRELEIPNSMVVDFINTNPMSVIRSYDQRMSPKYEFDIMFDGKNIDEVLLEIRQDGLENGMSINQVNKSAMQFRHSYDVALRQNIRNPTRWDSTSVRIFKDIASVRYLPLAALGTVTEPAVMSMNHGFKTITKGFFANLNNDSLEIKAIKDNMPRWYGEAFELAFFGAQHRFHDDASYNNMVNSKWENAKNSFYVLNGLTHATVFLKNWESLNRVHSLIDYSKKLQTGKATEFEKLFLLRSGISDDMAAIIAKAPVENTKTDNTGLWLANIDKWDGVVDSEVQARFQTSVSNGILNTILMGTPADRPIMMDKVMYVPTRIGKLIGLKEDPKFTGYARVESAFLSLPLQFYSYLLAATNKITNAVAQGMVKPGYANIAFTTAMFLGSGYLQYQLRVPEWRQRKDTWPDVLARSIDYSGLFSVYSDLFYQGLHFKGEMGGDPRLFEMINPKYDTTRPAYGKASAFIGPLGAVPSYIEELSVATKDMINGDWREGGAKFLMAAPFGGLWFIRDVTNSTARVLRGN